MFAETTTPKKTGSKSQMGRWKGLDEDISDDQVWQPRPVPFYEKGLPLVKRVGVGITGPVVVCVVCVVCYMQPMLP